MIPARRLHEMRTMALWPEQTLSQVMGPTCSAFFMILRSLPSIFQGSHINQIYHLGIEGEESANAELDDEHVGNAFASPRFTKESEAEASLAQTYHSNEENLLRGAQSALANTGQSVVWPTQRKSSRELEYKRIKTILQIQEEQLLTEASSEILKHENKEDLTQDSIRGLKGQVESQDTGSQAYSRRLCTIETRTGSSSRRGSRSRTSSSREP